MNGFFGMDTMDIAWILQPAGKEDLDVMPVSACIQVVMKKGTVTRVTYFKVTSTDIALRY